VPSRKPEDEAEAMTHSTPGLSIEQVVAAYDLPSPATCDLLSEGLNDVYLVQSGADRYLLKLYRAGWRTRAEVLYEVEALLHMDRHGVDVALPVVGRDGSVACELPTPEGARQAILFTWAAGRADTPLDESYARRIGRAAAAMHAATDDFRCPHPRFSLDLEHLLSQPLNALLPLLEDRPGEANYLRRLAERLRRRLERLPASALDWGFCHGDIASNNIHATEETLTLFDFDCGGSGWRAYDLATFQTAVVDGPERYEEPVALWRAFLAGYRERRPLGDVDLEAVSLFVAMRQIWILGVHVTVWQASGSQRLPPFFDHMLEFLGEWESTQLAPASG
jgi:Ser/Thr protein kinase RdoA (MazF antagonist)